MGSEETVDVSENTLENAPARMLQFLLGVGSTAGVKAALVGVGYSAKKHAEGFSLVNAVDTYNEIGRGKAEAPVDERVVAVATTELDSLDEKWFGIAGATLEAEHPTQHAFVFEGLAPAQGAASVRGWQTFVKRLAVLDKGPLDESGKHKDNRSKKDRDADHAALATLAERRIDADFLGHIRALLKQAAVFDDAPAPSEAEKAAAAAVQERRTAALKAVYVWHKQWSKIASKIITRRDWLVTLGLAERKSRVKETGKETGKEPAKGGGA